MNPDLSQEERDQLKAKAAEAIESAHECLRREYEESDCETVAEFMEEVES